ncbi:unnamed protein product [Miscanthus lutarioriparius]|uniref:Uncharacterized protein n=1 Tax=Miscanthus lutarioriparius TaxID=422564 RepID=A0A811N0Z0_9POAL|nr:unnamed protein product [Miscanthus lutarioriparius]
MDEPMSLKVALASIVVSSVDGILIHITMEIQLVTFWGIFALNHSSSSTSSNFFVPFRNGDLLSGIGNNNVNWGNPHHVPTLGANNCSFLCTRNFGYGSNESNFGQGSNVYGRNVGSSGVSNLNQSTNGYARNFGDSSIGGGSIYGDTTSTSWIF